MADVFECPRCNMNVVRDDVSEILVLKFYPDVSNLKWRTALVGTVFVYIVKLHIMVKNHANYQTFELFAMFSFS